MRSKIGSLSIVVGLLVLVLALTVSAVLAGDPEPSGHPFTDYKDSAKHWSSTTVAKWQDNAWTVGLPSGCVERSLKTNDQLVWPLRGGQ